jgi:hypothetical protein
MSQKLLRNVERDLRNQRLIEQMKQLTPRGKLLVFINRHRIEIIFGFAAGLWTIMCVWGIYLVNA